MSERPTLIPGCRRILHGGDYNPDQWLGTPEILDEDFRLMELAGCNAFSVGIFAWTSYEREEGRYDFGWLDRLLDRMARAGHRVMLATPSGAKPAWLSQKYPEVRRVDRHGRREPHAGRHNHCWSSPIYREKVAEIDTRLAERYHAHPALGLWHVSNEYSGECYCDLCLASFHRWLEARYGSIEALNEAWWTSFWSHTFTDFEQIDPRDRSIDALGLDHRRFNTDQVLDFLRWEVAAIRRHSRDVPCTTNLMGTFAPIDYSRLVSAVDLVADDQYPGYSPDDPMLERTVRRVSFKSDLHRCFKPERPWLLLESCPDAPQWKHPVRLKRPGLHQAEMLQALGHGAEGTCYFQWRKGRGGGEKLHGAVVDHVGHEHTRVFRDVAALGACLKKLEPIIGSEARARVALVFDWEARWAFEASEGVKSTRQEYEEVCVDHYSAFARQAVSVDVIDSGRDLSGYALVVLPQLFLLRPGVAARIARFVEQGGVAVATYYTGYVDPSNRCFTGGFPGDGLMDVFGIWNEETDWLTDGVARRVAVTEDGLRRGLEPSYEARGVCAVVHPRGARPLAVYAEDFFRGTPALTEHRLGRGRAFYQATALGGEFLRAFYAQLVDELSVPRALGGELPPGVAVQRRARGEREFLFLQNFSGAAQRLTLPGAYADLLSGDALGQVLELPAWGSTVIASRGGS